MTEDVDTMVAMEIALRDGQLGRPVMVSVFAMEGSATGTDLHRLT